MARLEELAEGVVVECADPDGSATVIDVEKLGKDSVEVSLVDISSKPGGHLLF